MLRRLALLGTIVCVSAGAALAADPAYDHGARRADLAGAGSFTAETILVKGPPWCLAPTDTATANRIVRRIRGIASSTDSLYSALRDSLGFMPQVAPQQVVAVTDEATCRKASRTLDTELFVSAQLAAVHLTKVGSWYAIIAPGSRLGEFTPAVWTDNKWTKKAVSEF